MDNFEVKTDHACHVGTHTMANQFRSSGLWLCVQHAYIIRNV